MKPILTLIILWSIIMSLHTLQITSSSGETHILTEADTAQFEIVNVTTIREKDNVVREEHWRGIHLTDIMQKYGIAPTSALEFMATDNYLINLKSEEIATYNPIIAIERNDERLTNKQYRLLAKDMPDMLWISNIASVKPFQETQQALPKKIYTHTTILQQIRLNADPKPFVDAKGYSVFDIINLLAPTTNTNIRLMAKDGIEQMLPAGEYFKGAYLMVADGAYNIQAPDMPVGMWLKDVMLIEINGNIIFFYQNVEYATNTEYIKFIDLLKQKDWEAKTETGVKKITDWSKVNWAEIHSLQ